MINRIKEFIIKSFGRKMIAWYTATVALFLEKIDGWQWIAATIVLLGLVSAEKIQGIKQRIIDKVG